MAEIEPPFTLNLAHILGAAGIDLADVLLIRHVYRADGIPSAAEVTPQRLLDYVAEQDLGGKFPSHPPTYWLSFLPEGGHGGRLYRVHENRGELPDRRTETYRYYDIVESPVLDSLINRLVVRWTSPINWVRRGAAATTVPVSEIADPSIVPFPGFDRVILSLAQLQAVMTERILGRWRTYAGDGHGGNVGLLELKNADVSHPQHYQFSLLRVFGPHVPQADIDAAESHFKRALLSTRFGLNRN